MQLNDEEHPDILALYPAMLTCLTHFIEQLVKAGLEIYPRYGIVSVTYSPDIETLWYWRLTTFGAESLIGYPDMHAALIAALMHMFQSGYGLDDRTGRVPGRN